MYRWEGHRFQIFHLFTGSHIVTFLILNAFWAKQQNTQESFSKWEITFTYEVFARKDLEGKRKSGSEWNRTRISFGKTCSKPEVRKKMKYFEYAVYGRRRGAKCIRNFLPNMLLTISVSFSFQEVK